MADGRGYSWEDDPGPPTATGRAELLAITPIHRGLGREVVGREAFRWHHGPMLCRGRPDGSAKVWVGSSGDRGLRPTDTNIDRLSPDYLKPFLPPWVEGLGRRR